MSMWSLPTITISGLLGKSAELVMLLQKVFDRMQCRELTWEGHLVIGPTATKIQEKTYFVKFSLRPSVWEQVIIINRDFANIFLKYVDAIKQSLTHIFTQDLIVRLHILLYTYISLKGLNVLVRWHGEKGTTATLLRNARMNTNLACYMRFIIDVVLSVTCTTNFFRFYHFVKTMLRYSCTVQWSLCSVWALVTICIVYGTRCKDPQTKLGTSSLFSLKAVRHSVSQLIIKLIVVWY